MRRLDWNIVFANAIRATHDEWVYTITFRHDGQWLLGVETTEDRGPDWRKWFTTAFLQDAMAIAQALAAGEDLA